MYSEFQANNNKYSMNCPCNRKHKATHAHGFTFYACWTCMTQTALASQFRCAGRAV